MQGMRSIASRSRSPPPDDSPQYQWEEEAPRYPQQLDEDQTPQVLALLYDALADGCDVDPRAISEFARLL